MPPIPTSAASTRLSARDKTVYGVADFGGNLVGIVANTWLLYYLVNIAQLPAVLAGLAFLAGRLFDALVDPAIGAWTDRVAPTRGRLGVTRAFAVPAGAMFALIWLVPSAAEAWRFPLACLSFMLLSALYSLATIPYLALGPELTRDYDERTSLNSVRLGFSMLATLVGVAAPPLVVLGVTGATDLAASDARGWLVVGVLAAVAVTAAFLITAFGVREPARRAASGRHALMWRGVREVLSTFGFAPLLGLFLATSLGFTITNSLLPFFIESVLRLPGSAQSPILGGLFLTATLTFPLWVAVSARAGKRVGVMLGIALIIVSLALYVYVVPRGETSAWLVIALLINGAGISSVALFPWAMLPDVIEFDEARHGVRREGLFYALLLMLLKASGAFAVFSNALVTSLLGYRAGQAQQSPETVAGLALMMGPVAASLFALGLAFAWRFPITRENHAAVRARLTLDEPARILEEPSPRSIPPVGDLR